MLTEYAKSSSLDNVYGAVVTAMPLQEFTRFI